MSANQTAETLRVDACDECGERHEATYSHESQFGQGAIYEVICGGVSDFYTAERVSA